MYDIFHRNVNDFFKPISHSDLEKKVWFRTLRVLHGILIVVAICIAILIGISSNNFAAGFLTVIITLVLLRILAKLIVYILVGSSRSIN